MLRLRLLNAALAAVFLLLMMAQLGDPSARLWILLFGTGVFWTAAAAIFPKAMTRKPVSMLLSLTTACMMLALLAFWPDVPGWWNPAVFVENAEARQGISMIMLVLGMIVPLCTSVVMSREERRAEAAEREAEITARHTGALAAGQRD